MTSKRRTGGRSQGLPSITFGAAVILGLALGGCYAGDPVPGAGSGASIEMVRELYAGERFGRAVEAAAGFIRIQPGSRHLDEAVFLLGRAQYEEGEYLEAETQLRRLLRDFPNSDFAEESLYYQGLAILSQSRGPELDQTETEAAHIKFREYLNRFPDGEFSEGAKRHIAEIREKLAEKAYRNGITYSRNKRSHDAALFYFEQRVFRTYPETSWAAKAAIKMCEIYKRRGDWNKVAEWASRILADFPGGEEADEASRCLDRAQKQLGVSTAATDSLSTSGN